MNNNKTEILQDTITFRHFEEIKYGEKKDIVADGDYRGYRFIVRTTKSHPCAYVILPEGHKFNGVDYDEVPIYVHGGLTFGSVIFEIIDSLEGYAIGWDYAHYGDYVEDSWGLDEDGKKYTTSEIVFGDIVPAINQLVNLCEGDN